MKKKKKFNKIRLLLDKLDEMNTVVKERLESEELKDSLFER